MTMTRSITLAVLLIAAAPAAADDRLPNEQVLGALGIEWMIANCGADTVQPLSIPYAFAITGAYADQVQLARLRAELSNRLIEQLGSIEAACQHLAGQQ